MYIRHVRLGYGMNLMATGAPGDAGILGKYPAFVITRNTVGVANA